MMLRDMHKTIVDAIPSPELKREIEIWQYRFSELDLIKLAFACAPSFGRVQSLLELVSREASEPVSAYARTLMHWQLAVRGEFCREDGDSVYELTVRSSPDEVARFVCQSTVELRARQKSYLASVGSPEKTYTRAAKLSISTGDEKARAELLPNGLFKSVKVYNMPCPSADGLDLVHSPDLRFPPHIANRALVRCVSEGFEHYGVNLSEYSGLTEYMYIIPLDSRIISQHDYGSLYSEHEHVLPPFVFAAEFSELDDRQRADYFAFLEYLDKISSQ